MLPQKLPWQLLPAGVPRALLPSASPILTSWPHVALPIAAIHTASCLLLWPFLREYRGKIHVLGGSLPSDKGVTFERQRVPCVNVKQDAYRLTQSFLD